MPGLVSTLLNHAYSTPSRLVHTFLQVTEQVWQPMHLSRFSTMPICALIFILCSFFLQRAFEPVNLVHLAHQYEFIAVGTHRAVVIEAVRQLRVAADHVRRLWHGARHRVMDAAPLARHLRAGH